MKNINFNFSEEYKFFVMLEQFLPSKAFDFSCVLMVYFIFCLFFKTLNFANAILDKCPPLLSWHIDYLNICI